MTQKMKSVFFSLCKREFNVSELLNNIRYVVQLVGLGV
jgi:hypothetical protein